MKMLKRLLLYGALAFVGLILLAAFVGNKNVDQPPRDTASVAKPTAQAAAKPPDLELLEDTSTSEDFGVAITGRIRNNTAKKYSYAQVTYNLYNKQNEQVGTALANVNGLEPGSVWKFKAAILQKDATNYKLDKISGY